MLLMWCYQRFSVLVTAYYMAQQTSKALVMGLSLSKVFLVKLQHMEGKALHILEIVVHLFTVHHHQPPQTFNVDLAVCAI